MSTTPLGIVILAAGEASRMGQAKQLLTLQGQTLLEICLQKAVTFKPETIVVVLGAHLAKTQPEVARLMAQFPDQSIHWVENQAWATGMGSSIRTGVQQTLEVAPVQQILMLLADQPLIRVDQLQNLLTVFAENPASIVASRYKDTFGVPAVFAQTLFDDLLQLNEQAGAKKVMKQHQAQMQLVDLPEAAFDLDTPKEYEEMKATYEK